VLGISVTSEQLDGWIVALFSAGVTVGAPAAPYIRGNNLTPPDPKMPTPLKRAARFQAHAVTCLTNAEAAPDDATRRAHLAVAKHFTPWRSRSPLPAIEY
jgi:hypothetical protein